MNRGPLTDADIRWHLLRSIASVPPFPSVTRAMPFAFPVISAAFSIRQRQPVPMGMANRFVLEALSRFGPASAAELHDLLGLGVDVICHILDEVQASGGELTREGQRYVAGGELRERLKEESFSRMVVQRHRFLINGVTGTLLPVNFWKRRDDLRLTVRANGTSEIISEPGGQPLSIRAWTPGRLVDGADALRALIDSGDATAKANAGVPEGATGLAEPGASEISSGWVLSTLLMRDGGSVDIIAAGEGTFSLVLPPIAHAEYWRITSRPPALRSFFETSAEEDLEALARRWPSGTQIYRDRQAGQLRVQVKDPEQNLSWEIAADGEEASEQRRLREALIEGVWWNPTSCFVSRLVPHDTGTAGRVCVLSAVRALRRALRRLDGAADDSAPFLLTEWWSEWQQTFANRLDSIRLPRLDLQTLLAAANTVADTEFQDMLDVLREEQGL